MAPAPAVAASAAAARKGGDPAAPVLSDTVTLGAPLADGASINVQFLLGIQKTGRFRFYINVEALP